MSDLSASTYSSEDYFVDRLKTVRPYTEAQLLQLHQNVELENSDAFVEDFLKECQLVENLPFYRNVADLKRARELLAKCRSKILQLKDMNENLIESAWEIETHTIKKRSRCSDSRLVEGKHTYKEARLNETKVKSLEENLQNLKSYLINDYCNHFYTSLSTQQIVENEIHAVIEETDELEKHKKLQLLISCLFAFQRNLEDNDNDFCDLTRKWTTCLVSALLQNGSQSDCLFLLNHILRCPGGVSIWTSSFVQCESPLLAHTEEDGRSLLNHCLTVISTILSPVKDRDRFVGKETSTKPTKTSADDLWHLVDTDIDEGEDVLVSKKNLTETDIIRLLQQVPFDEILRYVSEARTYAEESSGAFRFGEVSEFSMLKLLAVATQIIQILRQGLITFNCLRFRTLTDYITSLIRKTVCAVSGFWEVCKNRIETDDQALMLRLQVEYDHFVLRSVIAILSSQRYGIWKFVSVIPFEGVTESMMWHIVWVFYNNGRDEVDELGGLCPYFSDSYWRAKFSEPAMKYLFRERLPPLSFSESECLLMSLANMVKSRSFKEADFINTISVEIFEIGFLMTSKGENSNNCLLSICTELFSDLVVQHPFLVSALVTKIRDSNCFDEQCLQLFEKLPLQLWKPEENIFILLGDWLAKSAMGTIFNKLSRLIMSKLNWGVISDGSELFLGIKYHRLMAVCIYDALVDQFKLQENIEVMNCIVYQGFDEESLMCIAKSSSRKAFVEFCWRMVLMLKLHLSSQPNTGKLEEIPVDTGSESDSFYPLPNVNIDGTYLSLFKGLELNCPFAIYLTLSMTENGHNESLFEENYARLLTLINSKNYIPAMSILNWFLPFYAEKLESLLSEQKFISSLQQLILFDGNEIVNRVVGLLSSQLNNNPECKKELFIFWLKVFCDIAVGVMKQNSSSWFMDSSKGLDQVLFLLDHIIMLGFFDDTYANIILDTLIEKSSQMQTLKIPTGGWLNWGSSSKKSEWISPLHYLSQKSSQRVWFSWAVIKSDMVKMEKLWEGTLSEMNRNIDISADAALKAVCARLNVPSPPFHILPLNSWAQLAIESPSDHILQPLIWYNFFACFFASFETSGSFGLRIVLDETVKKLKSKLNVLVESYHKKWMDLGNTKAPESDPLYAKMTRLCRAFLLWLEDTHLHDPFVDIERLPRQYCGDFLKLVMNGTEEAFRSLVDEKEAENEILRFVDLWNQTKDIQFETVIHRSGVYSDFANFGEIKPYPPPEFKHINGKTVQLDGSELLNQTSKTTIALLQHNMRLILEENKYYENRFTKLSTLCTSLIELLSDAYQNLQKEVQLKIPCDKDGYDPDGCCGPANIVIEFLEATENTQKSKLMERNKIDLGNLLGEIMESPNDRIVSLTVYLGNCIPLLEKSMKSDGEDVVQCLLEYFLSSVSDANSITFPPTKHLFNILVDSLNFETQSKRDSTSQFVLLTTLTHPHTIQFLAPLLVPLKCTAQSFLTMYEVLQTKIEATPTHIFFVLLSKFDVNSWLKVASGPECNKFFDILGKSLYTLGKNPEPEKQLVLGLYRKHLQYAVICRFPLYVEYIFKLLLNGMSSFKTYPALWNDVLLSFGFYVQNTRADLTTLVVELTKYADHQPLFSANELYPLFKTISSHFDAIRQAKFRLNFLHHFHEYVDAFSLLLSTLSFMWINVNSRALGNFQNVWNPFLDCWRPWLFPPDYSEQIEEEEFERIWDLFVANLQYFIRCFYGLSSCILSMSWQVIASFFVSFKGDLGKNYTIIQEKMKVLCWNRFVPTEEDITIMHQASEHEKGAPNVIITHILHSVNWRNCAQFIPYERIPQSIEKLTYTIISVVNDPLSIAVSDIPFHLVSVESTHPICHLLRKKVNLRCYFDSNDELMSMWLATIKAVCSISRDSASDSSKPTSAEKRKAIIFTYTMTGIVEDALNMEEGLLIRKASKAKGFFMGLLDDLFSSFTSADSSHRKELLRIILEFVKIVPQEETQNMILGVIEERIKDSGLMILDYLNSASHVIPENANICNLIENSFLAYTNTKDPSWNLLLEAFDIPLEGLTRDFYSHCIQNNAFLCLFLAFEKQRHATDPLILITEVIDWSCQLKPLPTFEPKVIGFWYSVVRDSCALLAPDETSLPLMKSCLRFSRFLLGITEEVVSQGFLSFIKFTKKLITPRAAFITLSLAILLLKRIDELVTNSHPLYPELQTLIKSSQAKVNMMKKHKAFVEINPLLEKAVEFFNMADVQSQVPETLHSWLLAYYSDAFYFNFLASSITSKK